MNFIKEYYPILSISLIFLSLGLSKILGYKYANRKCTSDKINKDKIKKEIINAKLHVLFSILLVASCMIEYIFNLNYVIGACVFGWLLFIILRFIKKIIFNKI